MALSGKGPVAWADPGVEFYLSREGIPEALSEAEVEAAVEEALSDWQAPECASLRPRFVGWVDDAAAPADEVNTIAWVADWHARGLPSSAPGNTDVAYRGSAGSWEIAEADVLLNAEDFDWSELSLNAVVTHELGHALGLDHPCEDGGANDAPDCADAAETTLSAVMYPNYDPTRASLGDDDVAGICYLYPVPQECGGGCGLRAVCVEDECHATCGDDVCKADQACGAWGCGPSDGCLELDCEGWRCKRDDECGPLLRCSASVCTPGKVRWGEACKHNTDCADGGCVGGTCQPVCQVDDECSALGHCEETDDGRASACIASGAYETGTRCAMGEDCRSGLCVFTDARNVCTLACDADASCPKDWTCGTANKRRVCIPPKADDGCSLARPAGAPGSTDNFGGGFGFAPWMFVATALLATRKLRRKKQP